LTGHLVVEGLGEQFRVPTNVSDPEETLEQEVARGESERTPLLVLGGVWLVVAFGFALALAIAVAAYLLAR
jgi:hypothetical protein